MKKNGIKNETIKVDWSEVYQKLKENEGSFLRNADPDGDERKIILKKRADSIAKEVNGKIEDREKLEVLAFKIESESYAIEVSYINKVYMLKDLTSLPGISPYIIGIINVRGQIVPVIDFRKIFELPDKKNGGNKKVIVVLASEATFGLLADEVLGLESILVNEIQRDLPTLNGVRVEYLQGVTHNQLVILDPVKIATHKSIVMNDEI